MSSCSNDVVSKLLAFLGALVLGAAVAVLYGIGVLTAPLAAIYVALGLTVLILVVLLVLLFGCQRGWHCLCRWAGTLLAADLPALVLTALLAAALPPSPGILATIAVGVAFTPVFFSLLLLWLLLRCILQTHCGCRPRRECSCECSCTCGCNACPLPEDARR